MMPPKYKEIIAISIEMKNCLAFNKTFMSTCVICVRFFVYMCGFFYFILQPWVGGGGDLKGMGGQCCHLMK